MADFERRYLNCMGQVEKLEEGVEALKQQNERYFRGLKEIRKIMKDSRKEADELISAAKTKAAFEKIEDLLNTFSV